jgi:hypothetical protein
VSTMVQPPVDEPMRSLKKRVRSLALLLIVVSAVLATLATTLGILGWRKLEAIAKTEDDIQFTHFVTELNADTDSVQPTVNTIQFLHRGYSIEFDSVQYTQDGLALSGKVGNPTNLWVSSLALDMTARPYPYRMKEKWLKSGRTFWWMPDWDIGHAQTTVGLLAPGSAADFHITIPNVKQTPEGFLITVSFSGERYQYLGK